jgi:peptidoglycan/xylan/chitin deacetylase (PgdA/CDA1 family)
MNGRRVGKRAVDERQQIMMTAMAAKRSGLSRAGGPWFGALQRIAQTRAIILGYHGVANCHRMRDPFLLSIGPAKFRVQLELMLAAGFRFVTVKELARLADGGPPPPGLAAVTFDDGMRSTLTNALPILRELGICASLYVPTGWLGGHTPWIRGEEGTILNPEELLQLADAGWEVGTHTLTHADLSTLDYGTCRREIEDSCRALEQIVGNPVETLAYPFGRYGEAAVEAARTAGLRAALTTGSGSWRPFELTRAMIGAADPFPLLLLKMTDRYEPLLSTIPLRALRSSSKLLRRRLFELGHEEGTRADSP